MYRKILVPLDGSKLSESILDQVKSLVNSCKASKVVLFNVVEPFRDQPYRKGDNWVANLQKEAVRVAGVYLIALKKRLNLNDLEVETVVVEGDAAQAILSYSTNSKVDLIVMNAKGHSAGSRWIFGSVTNRVIQQSHIPVLVAPSKILST
jgi:nucleotide-binding universal stress UspA family protein